MINLKDIYQARENIGGIIHHTPMFTSTSLNKLTGMKHYLKAENLQKTGSFKSRGAANKVNSLDSQESNGVITVSSGNHGQATAYVAGALGIPAVIMVPEEVPRPKIEAARSYGAEVIVEGSLNDLDEIIGRAIFIASERNLDIVHPFDDPLIISGQGTMGLEILEDLPDIDVVIVPVGGGGLIAGVAAAIKLSRPDVLVYGVGPHGACSVERCFGEKEPVQLTDMAETIADGIRTPVCGHFTLPVINEFVEDVITVTDEEIITSLRLIWERCKLVVEPAGAVALAALLNGKLDLPVDSQVVSILSGGNVDISRVSNFFI